MCDTCPKCGGPMVKSHSSSGFLSRHWTDGDDCLLRQLAQSVGARGQAEARANGAEAANEHLHNRIGKLKAEAKRLREALERIARCKDNPDPMGYLPAIAAEALAAKEVGDE